MTTRFFLLLLVLPTITVWGCENRGADPSGFPNGTPDPSTDFNGLPPRGMAWVVFGSDTVRAEIADTPQAQERGLMFREDLPAGEGMLFVYEDEAIRSFWMRNTYIPLDIGFMDRTQTLVDIQQMEPRTENLHESSRPAMFALEVPRGWFAAHGIATGDRATITFGPR